MLSPCRRPTVTVILPCPGRWPVWWTLFFPRGDGTPPFHTRVFTELNPLQSELSLHTLIQQWLQWLQWLQYNHSVWEDLDWLHWIKHLEVGSVFRTVRVQICSWNLLTLITHSIICIDCSFCMQINEQLSNGPKCHYKHKQ